MKTSAFCWRWMMASSFGVPVLIQTSGIRLECCLLLGAQFLEGYLDGIRFQGTAVGSHGDTQALEFRDQIPILHPKLFGQFVHTHTVSSLPFCLLLGFFLLTWLFLLPSCFGFFGECSLDFLVPLCFFFLVLRRADDVDFPAGQPGRQPDILSVFADGERQL